MAAKRYVYVVTCVGHGLPKGVTHAPVYDVRGSLKKAHARLNDLIKFRTDRGQKVAWDIPHTPDESLGEHRVRAVYIPELNKNSGSEEFRIERHEVK